jgi:putative two-component system response regulator
MIDDPVGQDRAPQSTATPQFPQSLSTAALILVADDDPYVRDFLVEFLSREGYATILATNGREALEQVDRASPDLVLLDVDMPEMDGFEVCRRLKRVERTALIPVTMLTGSQGSSQRTRGIEAGADDFLHKPIDGVTLRARIRTQLRLKRMTDQLERTETVIFSMARWVELKDHYTEGHLRRVAGFSEQTGRACGLSADELVTVRYAGILHDIGKIAVPDAILGKVGPLTGPERAILERHADHGAEIVAPLRFSPTVAPIIRAHHERWDGGGYPQRLQGDAIPIGARIIAVVDAWDAMSTDRPYRSALEDRESIRRLREGAGVQWDARVVDVFLDLQCRGVLLPMELGLAPEETNGEPQGESRQA